MQEKHKEDQTKRKQECGKLLLVSFPFIPPIMANQYESISNYSKHPLHQRLLLEAEVSLKSAREECRKSYQTVNGQRWKTSRGLVSKKDTQ